MKNKNISIQYSKGKPISFTTESTEELILPRLCFGKQEEAELIVAIGKLLQVYGKDSDDIRYEIIGCVSYIFRILNIRNNWSQ